jgi:hypothetical protein
VTASELTVLAALGASLFTGLAALVVMWLQERLRERRADDDAIVRDVGIVLSTSLAIIERGHVWSALAQLHSKPGTQVALLLRLQMPIDFVAMYEPMIIEHKLANEAGVRVVLQSGQEIAARTNAVLVAAADMLGAVMPSPPIRRRADPSSAFKGWGPGDVKRAEQVEQNLTEARQALALAVRRRLRRPAIDVFELPAEFSTARAKVQQQTREQTP